MIYTGGFFSGASFVDAFANSSASVGLVLGGAVALVFTFIYYMMRDVLSFQEFTECIPEGFKSMIAPILILTMAWTLSGMTNLLGAKVFVADMVAKSAGSLQGFLPMVIFLVAAFLAFATGTSWGTFSILIPIAIAVFGDAPSTMLVMTVAACLSGAVCGDHISPISDTTILASAGAQCNHIDHVSTQMPYALMIAAMSFVGFLVGGVTGNGILALGVGAVLLVLTIAVITARQKKKA